MDNKVNSIKDPIEIERMRLGKFEFKAMNNLFRRFIQKYFEFLIFPGVSICEINSQVEIKSLKNM